MITIYRSTTQGLEQLPAVADGCWVNAVDPTPDEVAQLQAWGVPAEFVTYVLDLDERPRSEHDEGHTLIILRAPYAQNAQADIPYSTVPLAIIFSDRLLFTICRLPQDLAQLLLRQHLPNVSTTKKNRFVLRLFLSVAGRYLGYLGEINQAVDQVEDRLQRSLRNQEVLELLKYQKSLTYFTTALRSNKLMLERLQRGQLFQAYPEDAELLDDVLTENEQAIEMTSIASDILSQMMDAFASIISNNLNVVMKFLASVTVVLTIPALIASLYGMNVPLPGQGHPAAFVVVSATALFAAGAVLFVFWRKDWL
ncbi:MAG: magnesium transporter CorA family protein [Anaerolineales bacterium]|nr:magnesium transporter CorA family protein [Anaerolineales bacterium]